MVSELYEILDRKDSAANYLVKLAEQISRNNWLAAMFLERAAFKIFNLACTESLLSSQLKLL